MDTDQISNSSEVAPSMPRPQAPPHESVESAQPPQPSSQQPVPANQKKNVPLIVGIVLVVALAGSGVFGYQYMKSNQDQSDTSSVVTDVPMLDDDTTTPGDSFDDRDDSEVIIDLSENWDVYTSSEYGFRFKHPPETIISTRDDVNYQYVRLENYTLQEGQIYYSLNEEEYYMQIFIYDHELNHRYSEKCEQLENIVNLGDEITAYMKEVEMQGDTGGKGKFELCIKTENLDIVANVTEGNEESVIGREIFSTFEFIDTESSTDGVLFSEPDIPFTFRYPENLEFDRFEDEHGTRISVVEFGPSQSLQTEFYDGINVSFTIIDLNGMSLDDYVDERVAQSSEVGEILVEKSDTSINNIPALTYTAQGLGTFTHVFVKAGDQAIDIVNFTHDPTGQGYEDVAESILGSFQLKTLEQ